MEKLKANETVTDSVLNVCDGLDSGTLTTLVQCLAVAINNLKRCVNFHTMNNSLLNGVISDEEYEKEINDNVDEYCLPAYGHLEIGRETLLPLTQIAELLGYRYLNDLKDIFGITPESAGLRPYKVD